MKEALFSFRPAVREITKDKGNFFLALFPVIIGGIIYYYFGSWFFTKVMGEGQDLIRNYVSEGNMGEVLYYIVATIVSILLFLLVNWTFVLTVSVIASPFNDILSSRIEKKRKGEQVDNIAKSFGTMFVSLLSTLWTEIKKVSFIILLSVVAFVIGYIPLLTPISLFITVLLLAINFVDYSWSRHEFTFGRCLKDIRGNVLAYALGGGFFFILVSIPLVNLIVPPLATSYFTILFLRNNEHSNQVTQQS